jgi:DNA polymerase-3 subunit epsilon
VFKGLKNRWMKKRLRDERFAMLFDAPHPDEIVVFDCETTGLNPKVDNIISIGAVKIRGNKVLTDEALHIYIEQDEAIDDKSITIHQIRNCDLDGALPEKEAIEQFLHFIENRKLVGYYLEFDVAMVNKYIKRFFGITLPNIQEEVSATYYDKKIGTIPQENVDLSFDTILETLKVPKLDAHNALNDAIMTALIYIKLQHVKNL